MLRRWNSYTPAVPGRRDDLSCGGGYFLWDKGRGTVIHPGYGFLKNFATAGCRLCDVHNIILTHAHGDHTAQFEQLTTLLHEYNAAIGSRTPGTRRQVRFFLSNGAMVKFATILPLRDASYVGEVTTLNPGWEGKLHDGLRLRALRANHDDVIARDQSVGLLFTAGAGADVREILFTGDTGLFPLKPDQRSPTPDTGGREVWSTYTRADDTAVEPDLMVLHIGSIKESEFLMDPDADAHPATACYPNHLGIIGVARLITRCKPQLAVVSEFGEEMRHFRIDLIRGLQEKVVDQVLKSEESKPRIVPGDLPFVYDIASGGVYCCVAENWVGADEIDFALTHTDTHPEPMVYYASDGEQLKEKPVHVKRYRVALEEREGLYFRGTP